jgi:outer membrane lipoprotein SlyB
MKSHSVRLLFALFAAALVTGCTFPSSRRTVPGGQANVMQRVDTGVVVSVREVTIEGRRSQLGLVGGGLVGGALGSGGKGVGGAVVQAGSAVAGAVAGQAVEEAVTRKAAQEIFVRLDDGSTVTVTQESATGLYREGDRVRVVHGGGGARVTLQTN